MDKYNIHNMLEDISQSASTELSKGIDQVNTKEMSDVIDMIKDLSEAEKNKMEACYYKSVIEAMENAEYGEDYDYEGRIRRGYSGMGNRRGYNQPPMMYDNRMSYMEDDMDYRMPYSNGAYGGGMRGMSSSRYGYSNRGSQGNQGGQRSSRYGYSHDEFMSNKSMYKSNSPEDMKKRADMLEDHMDDLYDMFKEEVKDLTPEEKQLWKSKLNRIINL